MFAFNSGNLVCIPFGYGSSFRFEDGIPKTKFLGEITVDKLDEKGNVILCSKKDIIEYGYLFFAENFISIFPKNVELGKQETKAIFSAYLSTEEVDEIEITVIEKDKDSDNFYEEITEEVLFNFHKYGFYIKPCINHINFEINSYEWNIPKGKFPYLDGEFTCGYHYISSNEKYRFIRFDFRNDYIFLKYFEEIKSFPPFSMSNPNNPIIDHSTRCSDLENRTIYSYPDSDILTRVQQDKVVAINFSFLFEDRNHILITYKNGLVKNLYGETIASFRSIPVKSAKSV